MNDTEIKSLLKQKGMNGWVCMLCVRENKIQGKKIFDEDRIYTNMNQFIDHIEEEHNIPAQKDNETTKETIKRFTEHKLNERLKVYKGEIDG